MRPQPPARKSGLLFAALFLAFALHAAFDSSLVVAGAHPSLSLAALLVACLFANGDTGAWLGFMVGLLEASYASRYIGSYIVTRTLAGYLVGLLEERIFRDNFVVAIATVFVGTVFTDTCFFLFAPQPNPLRWFVDTLTQSCYNTALAVPLFVVFRRLTPRAAH
jgi:rod shape-determining protein MreD